MAQYEYEVLTLKRVSDPELHQYRWHSDCHGEVCHPHEIGEVMNHRGKQGWHIGTHVADGRFGNIIILERCISNDVSSAPFVPIPASTPVKNVRRKSSTDPVVSNLKVINQSLLNLAKQIQAMEPTVVTIPTVEPAPIILPEYPSVVQTAADPQLILALQSLQDQIARLQNPTTTIKTDFVPTAEEKKNWFSWLKQLLHLEPIPIAA